MDQDNNRLSKSGDGAWPEYRRLVIAELERLATDNRHLHRDVSEAKTAIALLQLKSGAWGAIAGAVVAVGTVLLRFIGG